MCLALLAIRQHPRYPFILASNRDEFLARPTQALHVWSDKPDVLAGRDQLSDGSWLALNQQDARLALVTNVRDLHDTCHQQAGQRSRGLIVRDWVTAETPSAAVFCQSAQVNDVYAGFNLIAGYLPDQLFYCSNRSSSQANSVQVLPAGIHGLSNASINTAWPKVVRGKRALHALVSQTPELVNPATLLDLLADTTVAADGELPDTGIGLEKERWLSPLFITADQYDYGTRCSTVVLMDNTGYIQCVERTYTADRAATTDVEVAWSVASR